MSGPADRFKLRAGDKVWATLCVQPDGTAILEYDDSLTYFQVVTCPALTAYDSAGQPLTIKEGAGHVYVATSNGSPRLTLQTIPDVSDPKRQVQLVVKGTGAGSTGYEPTKDGGLVFNLRWIAPRV
jgi:hypothetical protein